MKNVFFNVLVIACVLFVAGCKKDSEKGDDYTPTIIYLNTDLEGLSFISKCYQDWDCEKGFSLTRSNWGNGTGTLIFSCEDEQTAGWVNYGELVSASYDTQKKLLKAKYNAQWLDYGAWAYRQGQYEISFYTNNIHKL